MFKTPLATALATALMLSPLTALAQSSSSTATIVPAQWAQRRAIDRNRLRQVYEQGFEAGAYHGERDARSRRGGDYSRHSEYRRWGNDRSADAETWRRGFAEGYREGYSRYTRDSYRGAYPGGGYGYPDRDYPDRGYPSYPERGYPGGYGRGYPGQGYPGGYGQGYPGQGYPGGGYGRYSQATQQGLEEGYREGFEAGRRNERYDPVREKRYRDGDSGYNSRYGSRDQYKVEYREAFREGYDRGYREARYR